jgi:hypothetical protein
VCHGLRTPVRGSEVSGTLSLNCKVQTYYNETVLPEDDPAGLKHVGGFYSEDNIHIVHLLVIIFLCDTVHGYGAY